MALTRRSFFGWLSSLLGVAGLAWFGYREAKRHGDAKRAGSPRKEKSSRAERDASPMVMEPTSGLSAGALTFIASVSARILPTTDLPGAREANVSEFFNRQLAHAHFRVFREQIEAAAKRHAGFSSLPEAKQDERLAAIQADDAHLFQVLLTLTLEGAFADPRHGGNHDCAGWKLLGIDRHECKHT